MNSGKIYRKVPIIRQQQSCKKWQIGFEEGREAGTLRTQLQSQLRNCRVCKCRSSRRERSEDALEISRVPRKCPAPVPVPAAPSPPSPRAVLCPGVGGAQQQGMSPPTLWDSAPHPAGIQHCTALPYPSPRTSQENFPAARLLLEKVNLVLERH